MDFEWLASFIFNHDKRVPGWIQECNRSSSLRTILTVCCYQNTSFYTKYESYYVSLCLQHIHHKFFAYCSINYLPSVYSKMLTTCLFLTSSPCSVQPLAYAVLSKTKITHGLWKFALKVLIDFLNEIWVFA